MMIMVSNPRSERIRAAAGERGAETPHRFRGYTGCHEKDQTTDTNDRDHSWHFSPL
jgi:hypothetical protein